MTNSPDSRPKIIGIAGGSGSGKTTLCRRLLEELGEQQSTIISCDNYYHPLDHLSIKERADVNFDHPDSIDFPLLAKHLASIRQGNSIHVPQYCFETHTRLHDDRKVEAKPVILVEGILLFVSEVVKELFGLRVFVVADATVRFERRLNRDMSQRGRSRESVFTQWQNSVERMFTEYVEPTRDRCDVEVDATEPISNSALRSLVQRITNL